jgi:hypothetical protein
MAGKPIVPSISQEMGHIKNYSDINRDTRQYSCDVVCHFDLSCHPDKAGNTFYTVTDKETNMKYHVDAKGKRTLIADLKDSHLINIINLGIRKLEAARRVMDEMDKPADQRAGLGSSFMKKMYDLPNVESVGEEAEQVLDEMLTVLPYYIFEALIRAQSDDAGNDIQTASTITFSDIINWQKTVQAIFGRQGRMQAFSSTKLLGMQKEAAVLDEDGFVTVPDEDAELADVLEEELEDIRSSVLDSALDEG